MIEVIVEDGLAIVGEILFGVGLALGRVELRECLNVNFLVSYDVKRSDDSLRGFFDLNVNRDVVLDAVVVVVDLGLNLDIAEPVGNV